MTSSHRRLLQAATLQAAHNKINKRLSYGAALFFVLEKNKRAGQYDFSLEKQKQKQMRTDNEVCSTLSR